MHMHEIMVTRENITLKGTNLGSGAMKDCGNQVLTYRPLVYTDNPDKTAQPTQN